MLQFVAHVPVTTKHWGCSITWSGVSQLFVWNWDLRGMSGKNPTAQADHFVHAISKKTFDHSGYGRLQLNVLDICIFYCYALSMVPLACREAGRPGNKLIFHIYCWYAGTEPVRGVLCFVALQHTCLFENGCVPGSSFVFVATEELALFTAGEFLPGT